MSWAELIAIKEEAKQMAAEDRAAPLVDCPVCGEVLDSNGRQLNCPMGHGTWAVGTTQAGVALS